MAMMKGLKGCDRTPDDELLTSYSFILNQRMYVCLHGDNQLIPVYVEFKVYVAVFLCFSRFM